MKTKASASICLLLIFTGCSAGGGRTGASLPPAVNSSSDAAQSRAPEISSTAAGYSVADLGTFGGSVSSAAGINERSWITGSANLSGDAMAHAALWRDGKALDLGTLGGPNSAIAWPNHSNSGFLAGISELSALNPYHEPWSCSAFFPGNATTHVCVGFTWRNNAMHALSTLGGYNGYAAGTNDFGAIAGWAENRKHDSTCNSGQVLQFKPVVWIDERIHALPTLGADPDGAATGVNDSGAVVGISGICDQAVGRFTARHAVIWENNTVREIPTFGGVSWNTPTAVNNRGEVVGFANVPGPDDTAGKLRPVAFFWSRAGGLHKIAPLPGDVYSLAEGLNDRGDIVGVSYSAGFASARAFLYHNGRTIDLNSVIPKTSGLSLLAANDINSRGYIAGQALVNGTTTTPAFLLTPTSHCEAALTSAASSHSTTTLPPSVRAHLRIPIFNSL